MAEVELAVAGAALPAGGAAGQIPVKQSATDFDVAWASPKVAKASCDVPIVFPLKQFSPITSDCKADATMACPPTPFAPGDTVLTNVILDLPVLRPPGLMVVQACVWITDLAGANSALLGLTQFGSFDEPFTGSTFTLSFTDHPPTIVGADLAVVDDTSIVSAAGGVYGTVVVLRVQAD